MVVLSVGDVWPEVEHHEEATQYSAMLIHLISDDDEGCQALELKEGGGCIWCQ